MKAPASSLGLQTAQPKAGGDAGREQKLKILYITSHDLEKQVHGASVRARNIFKSLARLGEVQLITARFNRPGTLKEPALNREFGVLRNVYFEPTPAPRLAQRLRHELDPCFLNTEWMQATKTDQTWLHTILTGYDLVWLHGLHAANGFGLWRWPSSVLDIDDIPSSLYGSRRTHSTGLRGKIGNGWKQLRWYRHERNLAARFDAVCVCSEPDIRKLNLPEKTFVLPNSFNVSENSTSREPANPLRVGFIGNFSHEPNQIGLEWFLKKIWPLILEKKPQARLRIAGANHEKFAWPATPNLDWLGWIEDSEKEMLTWSLSVVPVLTGSGTRVKIAEAFSRRCPVVSTSLGAYGYDIKEGEEIFLADKPAAFADRVHQLLEEPELGKKVAERAWGKFRTKWAWEAQAGQVTNIVKKVLSGQNTCRT